MAARGDFPVRDHRAWRHENVASRGRRIRDNGAHAWRIDKSSWKISSVYSLTEIAAFAENMSKIGNQCLNLVRWTADRDHERLKEPSMPD
jgi:hypothetical protein